MPKYEDQYHLLSLMRPKIAINNNTQLFNFPNKTCKKVTWYDFSIASNTGSKFHWSLIGFGGSNSGAPFVCPFSWYLYVWENEYY